MYHPGSYITAKSSLHLLDPRIKLAFVFGLSAIIMLAGMIPLIYVGLFLLILIAVSEISLRIIGQSLKPLLFFIILIFLVHVFFSEGDAAVRTSYLHLAMSWQGFVTGCLVTVRFICLIIAAVLLTSTTTPAQLIAAIKYFLRPLKLLRLPVDDIAVMIMLALRLLPLLLNEKERIETAQKARGYILQKFGLITRLRVFLSFAAAIMLGVFKRADEMASAMDARNYSLGKHTSYIVLKLTKTDFIALTFLAFLGIIFIALNFYFG
jgi:energy-coupling factor transport system permease protein